MPAPPLCLFHPLASSLNRVVHPITLTLVLVFLAQVCEVQNQILCKPPPVHSNLPSVWCQGDPQRGFRSRDWVYNPPKAEKLISIMEEKLSNLETAHTVSAINPLVSHGRKS